MADTPGSWLLAGYQHLPLLANRWRQQFAGPVDLSAVAIAAACGAAAAESSAVERAAESQAAVTKAGVGKGLRWAGPSGGEPVLFMDVWGEETGAPVLLQGALEEDDLSDSDSELDLTLEPEVPSAELARTIFGSLSDEEQEQRPATVATTASSKTAGSGKRKTAAVPDAPVLEESADVTEGHDRADDPGFAEELTTSRQLHVMAVERWVATPLLVLTSFFTSNPLFSALHFFFF